MPLQHQLLLKGGAIPCLEHSTGNQPVMARIRWYSFLCDLWCETTSSRLSAAGRDACKKARTGTVCHLFIFPSFYRGQFSPYVNLKSISRQGQEAKGSILRAEAPGRGTDSKCHHMTAIGIGLI